MQKNEDESYDFWLEGDTENLSSRLRKQLPAERLQAQDYRNRQADVERQKKEQAWAEREKAEKAKKKAERSRTVTINVTAPALPDTSRYLKKIKNTIRRAASKIKKVSRRTLLASGSIAVLLIVGVFVFNGLSGSDSKTKQATAETGLKDGMSFTPLVPKSKVDKQVNSENGFNYDKTRRTLNYQDTWAEAKLTISQQALPAKFKSDPASFKTLATNFNATQKLDTKKGDAYTTESKTTETTGNSTVSTEQIALLKTDKLLVFIRSDRKMENAVWEDYINLLTLN